MQLTPPGSACSILLGTGVVTTAPGSVENLHLVVSDINAARSQLVEWGVEVSEVETYGGVYQAWGDRRSHSDARVGCMVWSTTASSSAVRVSRSTSSRRRALNAAMVVAAS